MSFKSLYALLEKAVVKLYRTNLTMTEIGEQYSISATTVSYCVKKLERVNA